MIGGRTSMISSGVRARRRRLLLTSALVGSFRVVTESVRGTASQLCAALVDI